MKKFLLLVVACLIGATTMYAQSNARSSIYSRMPSYGGEQIIYPGMKYKELKYIYRPADWNGGYKKYSPGWAGVGSFFIPGLGQICCGEAGRGFAHVGINVGLGLVAQGCYNNYMDEAYLMLSIVRLGFNIWSIVDAVKVAKVKNMYETDMMRTFHSSISVDMYPSLNYAPMGNSLNVTPGMTLAISF